MEGVVPVQTMDKNMCVEGIMDAQA